MNVLTFVIAVYFAMTGPTPTRYTVEAETCTDGQKMVEKIIAEQDPVVMYCTRDLDGVNTIEDVKFIRPMDRMINTPILPQDMPTLVAR